jgi:hypothetical protein
MEFLIPGLILVALMVYASTKIKKSAAAAFEAERIETRDFIVEKPEGFLNALNRDASLELDIYSRDFGKGPAAGFRAVSAEVRIYSKRKPDQIAAAIAETVDVRSKIKEVIDGRKYLVIEARSDENEVEFRELYKLADRNGGVFEFRLKALKEIDSEIARKADLMFASFEVK